MFMLNMTSIIDYPCFVKDIYVQYMDNSIYLAPSSLLRNGDGQDSHVCCQMQENATNWSIRFPRSPTGDVAFAVNSAGRYPNQPFARDGITIAIGLGLRFTHVAGGDACGPVP